MANLAALRNIFPMPYDAETPSTNNSAANGRKEKLYKCRTYETHSFHALELLHFSLRKFEVEAVEVWVLQQLLARAPFRRVLLQTFLPTKEDQSIHYFEFEFH